jgi:3-oxoacyl-(acyl-carrier-protein) synthase
MARDKQDVLITGIGVISPIGQSLRELRSSLLENRSGISLWESPLRPRGTSAGVIENDFADQFTKLELPYMDRCSQLAILAARQAM